MGYKNYISENEAAAFAGVSANTLRRFAEAGYLEVESDSDGLRLYSRSSLADLFRANLDLAPKHERSVSNTDHPKAAKEFSICEPAPTAKLAGETHPTPEATQTEFASVAIKPVARLAPEVDFFLLEPRLEQPILPSSGDLESETMKFRRISELQEHLLNLREKEIADLKEQRNWLQSRIERLEEKSERDQVLLLAETQTIRQLVATHNRRSPLRLALEWFGIGPEKNSPRPESA